MAYNEETGEQAYKKVVRLFRNETKEWYHIHVNGEEIVCTGGHPFYVANLDKFIPARELKVGNSLLLSDNTCAIIELIQVEKLETPQTTYNFEVEDFHTYYVSDSKILVHNVCTSISEPIANERGAIVGSEKEVTLKAGKQLDRYGSLGTNGKGGRFVTNAGTPIEKLALPLENTGELTRLEVLKDFKAIQGIIAPHPLWGPGGGIQYYLSASVSDLIELGFLTIL